MEYAGKPKLWREVTTFYVAAVFFTWLVWLPAFLIQNCGISMSLPYDIFITAGTFVSSIAGFLFAYIFGGKTEANSLLKSLMNVHISVKWLLFIFLFLPAVSAVSCLIFYLSGGAVPEMQFPAWFIPVAFVYILVFMGPIGERQAGGDLL